MGSSLGCCCISRLPIKEGDEAYYLLLAKNPYQNDPISMGGLNGDWFPRTPPLKGTYNGYGYIDMDPAYADIFACWLDILKVDGIVRPPVPSSIIEPFPTDLRSLADLAHHGYLWARTDLISRLALSSKKMMSKKDINRRVEAMLKNKIAPWRTSFMSAAEAMRKAHPNPPRNRDMPGYIPLYPALIRGSIWKRLSKRYFGGFVLEDMRWEAASGLGYTGADLIMPLTTDVYQSAVMCPQPAQVGISIHLRYLIEGKKVSEVLKKDLGDFCHMVHELKQADFQWHPSNLGIGQTVNKKAIFALAEAIYRDAE